MFGHLGSVEGAAVEGPGERGGGAPPTGLAQEAVGRPRKEGLRTRDPDQRWGNCGRNGRNGRVKTMSDPPKSFCATCLHSFIVFLTASKRDIFDRTLSANTFNGHKMSQFMWCLFVYDTFRYVNYHRNHHYRRISKP